MKTNAYSLSRLVNIAIITFAILFCMPISMIIAGPIYDSFKKLEEKQSKLDPAIRTKQLKSTLYKSMKMALIVYYNYANHAKITENDITYEPAKETKKYLLCKI